MADHQQDSGAYIPIAQELSCQFCSKTFVLRNRGSRQKQAGPKRCPACRAALRKQQADDAEQRERRVRAQRAAEAKQRFEEQLKDWRVTDMDDILPGNDHVLYIIGNGFDLMHRVPSSYYAFRDFLGRQSHLRYILEHFLTVEDIWADFEAALAHFNIKAMCGRFIVSNWLDTCEAYSEDAGAAEFSLAVEAAADPILTVVNELPKRFRQWVESLSPGTADRPLRALFRNGKVLCFNYTEFVETLYGISESNVCYIHGCRRKKKYHPKEPLILGHLPGDGQEEYFFLDSSATSAKKLYRDSLTDAAQEQALHLIVESDENLTKHCDKIIAAHKPFFASLHEIKDIFVIGHSLAPVDWDYFSEIASSLPDRNDVRWYFGCHGLRDLDNLKGLLAKLELQPSAVSVFRTDCITTAPLPASPSPASAGPAKKTKCTSPDGRWSVKTTDGLLSVIETETGEIHYETMFSSWISDVCFSPSGKYLFAILRGADPGVFLFTFADGRCRLINELAGIQHQGVLNPRLKRVYLTEQALIFVYNSRVRTYSLADGALVSNRARRNARTYSYQGEDVSHLFLKQR